MPTLLHFGHVALPISGALAALGLIFAILLTQRTAPLAHVPPDALWDATFFAVLTAFVLSRLLLLIAYWPSFRAHPVMLLTVPSVSPLALFPTLLLTGLLLLYRRTPVLPALDAWAPATTLLWSFLALGHFLDSTDPGLPFSSTHTHAVALYAAAIALVLTLFLLWTLRRPHPPGRPAALALILTGLAQFLLTFLREPSPAPILALDPIQLLALTFLATGTLILASTHHQSVAAQA